MPKPFPNKASRLVRFTDLDKTFKDVLIAVIPHEKRSDGVFFSVGSYEVGVGRSNVKLVAINGNENPFLSAESVSKSIQRIDDELTLLGYEFASDLCVEPTTPERIIASAGSPLPELAVSFHDTYSEQLDDFALLPIVSGLRVWVVVNSKVSLLDGRSLQPINGGVDNGVLSSLSTYYSNPLNADTVLECFMFNGSLHVVDALMLKGNLLTDVCYKERIWNATKKFSNPGANSKLRVVQPAERPADEVRVLSTTRSVLKPVLYAKSKTKSVMVDKHMPVLASFLATSWGLADMTQVSSDGGFEPSVRVQMPVANQISSHVEYLVAGGYVNAGRIPVIY